MGNRRYIKDYERRSDGKDGRSESDYVYIGDLYIWDAPKKERNDQMRNLIFYGVGSMLLYLLASVTDCAGSRKIYILLPFIIALFPQVQFLTGLYRLLTEKWPLTRKRYDYSIRRIFHCMIALLILHGMSVLGEMVFVIGQKSIKALTEEGIFLLARWISLFFTAIMLRSYKMDVLSKIKTKKSEEMTCG